MGENDSWFKQTSIMEVTSPAPTDNEKQLGHTNPNSQTLESLGYAQEVKRRFSLMAMVATCVNLMCTWEALSRYVHSLVVHKYTDGDKYSRCWPGQRWTCGSCIRVYRRLCWIHLRRHVPCRTGIQLSYSWWTIPLCRQIEPACYTTVDKLVRWIYIVS